MKKVISVILALALCISLVPAAFATDTGYEWARNPKTYVYEFNNASHGFDAGTNSMHTADHDLEDTAPGYLRWGFVNVQNSGRFNTNDDYLCFTSRGIGDDYATAAPVYAPGISDTKIIGARTALALVIDVEDAGKYTPSITFSASKKSPMIDIFLLKESSDDAENWYYKLREDGNGFVSAHCKEFYTNKVCELDSSLRIGAAIDLYGSGNKTVNLTPCELEKGQYYLVFVPNGKNESATPECTNSNTKTYEMYVNLVNFTLSEELPATEEALDFSNLVYKIGTDVMSANIPVSSDKTCTSASIYKKDSSATNLTLYNISLANWEKTISVKTDGNLGSTFVSATATTAAKGYTPYEPYYTLDLTKTAPYAIESIGADGKLVNGGNSNINSGGYLQGLFTPKLYDSTNESYKSNPADRGHVAIRLNIPYSGKYKLSISNTYYTGKTDNTKYYDPAHAATKVYFGAAPESYSAAAINAIPDSSEYTALGWQLKNSMYTGETITSATAVDGFTIDVPVAGEYYVAFLTFPESLTNWNSTVYASNGLQMFNLSSITLTPLPGEMGAEEAAIAEVANKMTAAIAEKSSHDLSNSARVNVLTTTVNSDNDDFDSIADKHETTRGAKLTVKAPELPDRTFLYWTKGIGADRRVVSDSESYTLTAPAGGTYLTAVYKAKADTQTSVVFFDASGNELSRKLYDDGATIDFPSAPSLTDYDFEGWALAGTEGTVTSATATGNQMIFVAQFSKEPKRESVKVTVINGTQTDYAYGSLVKESATERENGNGSDVFLYWTKNGEIVSFEKDYSFLAAENCELEAVYGAYKPSITDSLRRIIISGSFAEFIGLDAAKEKGVLFNKNGGGVSLETATHKIAVKNGGNQLKFENDLGSGASVIGYAIMDDNTVIYGK